MKKYYFTFGHKQVLPEIELFDGHELHGHSLGNYYVKIEATDKNEATQVMFGIFGDQWSSCYSETAFQQMVKYNLKELIAAKPFYSPKQDQQNEN